MSRNRSDAIRLPSFICIQESPIPSTHRESSRSPVRSRRRTSGTPPSKASMVRIEANLRGPSDDVRVFDSETISATAPTVTMTTNCSFETITTDATPTCQTKQLDRLEWERRYILDLLLVESDVDWSDLYRRVMENPVMLTPVPWRKLAQKQRASVRCTERTSVTLYEQTILGALCSRNTSSEEIEDWSKAALSALELCPEQVGCSQTAAGHTALRDAVSNPSVPHAFIEAMVKTCPQSVHIVDCDGLTPIDHVLFGSHLSKHTAFLGPSRVQSLLMYAPVQDATSGKSSPLIRFLASGYSVNQNPCPDTRPNTLLEICNLFLEWDPRLVGIMSKTSSCSILHIAIRNYGNSPVFINELMKFRGVRELLAHRNRYGDLPLHVACAGGVPTSVLLLILRESMLLLHSGSAPHPLVWSANEAGYTPLDLEWMRHIESGRDFFSNRGFYQLDARGVRPYGNAYDSLLRDTVRQIIAKQRSCKQDGRRFLLDRFFLIIKYATCGTSRVDECLLDSNEFIVHQACMLVFPGEAFLPLPILELILWLNPDQVATKDHFGRLPLHHAVTDNMRNLILNEHVENDWYCCVAALLQQNLLAAKSCDSAKRLPLHLLLSNNNNSSSIVNSTKERGSVAAFDKTLFDLVKAFPGSIETKDPQSGFLPFQAAAQNALFSLEATFQLLRSSPGVIRPEIMMNGERAALVKDGSLDHRQS